LSCKNTNLTLILIFNAPFSASFSIVWPARPTPPLLLAGQTSFSKSEYCYYYIIITNLQPSSLGAFCRLLLVPVVSFEPSYFASCLLVVFTCQ
jgi:hypothetical protein